MPVLPVSLTSLLSLLRGAFTAPTFEIFSALVAGFIGRVGDHTVTGMWQAARLAGRLHHSLAHDFFSRARWSPDRLGLSLLDFLIERFVESDTPIRLAVDGTVFPRSGRKVYATFWHHASDAVSAGPSSQLRFGNCFVVVGLLVKITVLGQRSLCLPILFRLWRPTDKPSKRDLEPQKRLSQQQLAVALVNLIQGRYPKRQIELVGDAAFACGAMRNLSENVTFTARLRSNAAIYAPAPPKTHKVGRPRVKGLRLGNPKELATTPDSEWNTVEVKGRGVVKVLEINGIWYPVLRNQPVKVILARASDDQGDYQIALITTNVAATPEALLEFYTQRWSIETCFHDAKQVIGVGQARNRTQKAVERTVPFGFLCQTIITAWYALNGQAQLDVAHRRKHAPWYRQKRDPSMLDMLTSLRRELIRSEFMAQASRDPTQQQNSPSAVQSGLLAA